MRVDPVTKEHYKIVNVKVGILRDNVLHKTIEELCSVADVGV